MVMMSKKLLHHCFHKTNLKINLIKNMQKTKTVWWVIGIIVVIAFLLILGHFTNAKPAKTIASPSELPGLLKGNAPWDANNSSLRSRLKDIGLSPLNSEGSAMHIHEHIDISINGKPVSVPAGIGIDQIGGFISSIHTHRANGIIHIESPTIQTFTLGQFFDVWGVRLTSQCIGGYCTTASTTLKVYSNGKLNKGSVRLVPLKEHDEIFITYNSNKTSTTTVISKYAFPTGE